MGTNILKYQHAIRVGKLGSAPSTPDSGTLYWDTGASKLKLYNGSVFVNVADLTVLGSDTASSSGASLVKGENKAYANISGLTTYTIQDFLDRINAALATAGGSSFSDADFEIYDNVDDTKKIVFQASGIGTGQTRSITMPDADVNLGALTNSNISASAAIAYSKLNLSGSIVNADVNASAAIAYSKLDLSSSIVNADIDAAAAIAYSKLNLSGSIVNADINASAAIAYSKLDLSGSIVDADVDAGADIARSKLAAGTANRLVVNDGSGVMSDAAAITASRALASDSNGIPVASATTSTELGYVSGVTSAIQTQLNAKAADADVIKKDGSVAFTADQSLGGNKLTSVGTPTANTDAANKQYVDDVAQGLKPKEAVRVATTANITLSGEQTIDGVLTSTDRVLVKNQTDPEDNGIYVSAAGAWSRSTDFDSLSPIDEVNGAFVAVQEGTANAGIIFVQTGTVSTLGTDPVNFVFFNSSTSLVGGDGIDVSGVTISVDHDGQGLEFNGSNQLALELDSTTLSKSASGLKVADAGVTETQLNASVAGDGIAGGAGTALSVDHDGEGLTFASNQLALELDGSTLSKSASGLKVADGSLANAQINASAAIDATKIHDGSVSNTEFGYLDGVTSAIQTQLNGKLTDVVDDTSPQLGGTLDPNGQSISGIVRRGASASAAVEDEYLDSLSLTQSTTAVLAALTYDSRDFKGVEIVYTLNNGNDRRIGRIMVANDNADTVASSNVSIVDFSTETADVDVIWSAAINGNNIEISYTTGAGTFAMRADVKRIRA